MSYRSVVVNTYHHAYLREPHWTATIDNSVIGDPIGFALTEAEAVMDLFDQIAQREAETAAGVKRNTEETKE